MSTRVLVADDHEIFAQGLCALLDKEAEIEVIGRVTGGSAAVRLARELVPDIVIMDLSMADLGGIEATRLIKAEQPAVRVLCLSMHADRGFVMGALDAGASGYVLKDAAKEQLLHAIPALMRNAVYLSPEVTGMVVEAATSDVGTAALAQLTKREREVLKLFVQGKSTKEIASRLHLSVKTVGSHRAHIMNKLDVDSIAGLTRLAIREGLISATD